MNNKQKKYGSIVLTVVMVMIFVFSSSVFGFQDLKDIEGAERIQKLKEAGVLSGMGDDLFDPNGKVTLAQGVYMIVKGLDLNINHIRFIKEPKASDYFKNVADDAWYAEAFIHGHLNGMPLQADADPEAALTREQFADLLFKSVETRGDYAFIKIFMILEDEADVEWSYMDSIQKVLISKIAMLDKAQKFHPKLPMIRADAAVWLYGAIQFVDERRSTIPLPSGPIDSCEEPVDSPATAVYDVEWSTEAVTAEVNKVVINATLPHPGYGISVATIEFNAAAHVAVVYYQVHEPDPDRMYIQVVMETSLETYVASGYKVDVQPLQAEQAIECIQPDKSDSVGI